MHTYIHTYIHTYVRTYVHTYNVPTCCICMYTQTLATHIDKQTNKDAHTHTHTHTHARTHAHTHTHTHTPAHTHTHAFIHHSIYVLVYRRTYATEWGLGFGSRANGTRATEAESHYTDACRDHQPSSLHPKRDAKLDPPNTNQNISGIGHFTGLVEICIIRYTRAITYVYHDDT